MAYRWRPSRAAAREYGETMRAIEEFCAEHGIEQSRAGDSYYFTVNGQRYRVSNHTVEASNAAAYDEITGERRRELYHKGGREANTIYIHAGKTRIREIYADIAAGYALDSRGNRLHEEVQK